MKTNKPKYSSTYLSYDTRILYTWSVLVQTKGTVFADAAILKYLSGLIFAAIVSCCLVLGFLEDPYKLSITEFYNIIHYIKVFIAFMLGLFMQNCLSRWWRTVSFLSDLFLDMKKIVIFMNANDVPAAYRDTVQRLAVMSCYLLEIEVSGFYSDMDLNDERWQQTQQYLLDEGLATAEELKHFEEISVADRSLAVWSWIGVFLAETPNLAPPLKTNLVGMGVSAIDEIKQLKHQVMMQLPLMYSHMLALLVHVNNAMLAVVTGISVACLISDAYHSRKGIPTYHANSHGEDNQDVMDQSSFDESFLAARVLTNATHVLAAATHDTRAALYSAIQGIFVQLVSLLLQPVIYCAFLTIGGILADPFTNEKHGLPFMDYIQDLRGCLKQTNALAASDPEWLFSNSPGASATAGQKRQSKFGDLSTDVITKLRSDRMERAALSPVIPSAQPLLVERERKRTASEEAGPGTPEKGRSPRRDPAS